MKNLYTICLSFLLVTISILIANAQSQSWLWAKTAAADKEDSGNDVATDANGNVYVTGFFSTYTYTLGSVTLNAFPGIQTSSNVFIAKYDPSGNVLWARSAGGRQGTMGYSVATDMFGNVYLAGTFESSSLTFGTHTIQNANNDSTRSNIFLVKYDGSGNVIWAKSEGTQSTEYVNTIATDAHGNLLIGGQFVGSTNLSGIALNGGIANHEMFVAKYDSAGNIMWAKMAASSGDDVTAGIGSDDSGNVYVCGTFGNSSSMNFGTASINSFGLRDIFTAKYTASGDLEWARSMGGSGPDRGYGLAVDNSGNIYVTGTYREGTMNAGTFSLDNATPGNQYEDVFLVRYNSSGDVIWARSGTGYLSDNSYDVAADDSGSIYITGTYKSDTLTFGSTFVKAAGNDNDIFLTKYDSAGALVWIKAVGGFSRDDAKAIAADGNGNLYMTGFFAVSPLTFGSVTLQPYPATGGIEMFLAKLGAGGTTTAISEHQPSSAFTYPNPVKDEFYVTGLEGSWNLTIYNCQGQNIRQGIVTAGDASVNISTQAPGVYFLLLTNAEGAVKTCRVVKQ